MNRKKQPIRDWIVAYLIPRWVWKKWRQIKNPKWAWQNYMYYRWARDVKVGDLVCTCACNHVKVAELDDVLCIIDEDGLYHDLLSCCAPVEPDNSCHTWVEKGFEDGDTST